MRGKGDLALASGAAIVCAVLASVLPWDGARLVVALPLAFVLPGYAIVAGLGPRPLKPPQAIMLCLGCSLSVLCLGALLLNYTPDGIQTGPWAILLALVTVVGCGAAVYRRRTGEDEPADGPARWRPRPVDALLGIAALALAIGALVLANTPLKADGAAGFTSLWIGPAAGGDHGVKLGVASSEHGVRRYVLMVQAGGGAKQVAARFGLRPDDERAVTVSLPAIRRPTLVQGFLYRQSNPAAPLRQVRIWLRPGGGDG